MSIFKRCSFFASYRQGFVEIFLFDIAFKKEPFWSQSISFCCTCFLKRANVVQSMGFLELPFFVYITQTKKNGQ